MFILLTYSSNGFTQSPDIQALDFNSKSTEALNDTVGHLPSLVKEVVNSGSAVINEIKKPGCHSDTFKQFGESLDKSRELTDELDLDVIRRAQQAVWEAASVHNCSNYALDERFEAIIPATFTARGSFYAQSTDRLDCLYRNHEKLVCGGDYVSLEKYVKIKNYDLILLSTKYSGSGVRTADWKLIVEDGKTAAVKSLVENCFECEVQVERLKFRSNEVDFIFRNEAHRITGHFRNAALSLRKTKLDPREPLDKETCDWLYEALDSCKHSYKIADPDAGTCTMSGGGNAGRFFLTRIESTYAGISLERLDRQCREACSTGKAMDRETYLETVCRRKGRYPN
ncbi:hypothetical protein JQ615_25325 [Bradyrhizobium jicamae]|uniref:Uncharacterized protein n=1 Tax=Bradyrhizobium jicamae TaxID=280332 RepID=A0ABS5FPL5_9BRAD|nr:hypothetical protein [Bradyrhizobium jicamae]MBR0798715.1 hypothetical protein [Bradyrhizobium jicamae]